MLTASTNLLLARPVPATLHTANLLAPPCSKGQLRQPALQERRSCSRCTRCKASGPVPSFMSLVSTEGFIEVEAVEGIRLVPEGQQAVAEYLIKWKDGSPHTWERAGNLSEDLVRDYEDRWWGAARKGDFQALCAMLEGGRDVLAQALDENRRSALHFAAALGKQDCVRLLLEAGANPNLQDKDGYTPLHMAAGYMHTQAMAVLLEGGSDPQLRDNTGKDVVKLIDNIRGNMPLNVATIMQRLRLEEVCNALTDMVYEEVGITAILDERKADDGSREFLVSFSDGREDGWVAQRNVAADILADYEAGLEYRRARAIVDMVQVGTERRFKIQWEDDYPTSWEPEEHVPPNLIALFQRQNPALFEERVNAANDVDASSGVKREAYATQTDDVHIALRGVHAMHSSEHAFGGDVEVLPVKAQAGINGELLQQRHEGSGNTAVALR
ncbi:hypothetical protein V8C86DRAFT_2555004 [Haematococcus lacustris]